MDNRTFIVYRDRFDFSKQVRIYLNTDLFPELFKKFKMSWNNWYISTYHGFEYFDPTAYGYISAEKWLLFRDICSRHPQIYVEVFCKHYGIENLMNFEDTFIGEFTYEGAEFLDMVSNYRKITHRDRVFVFKSASVKYAYVV